MSLSPSKHHWISLNATVLIRISLTLYLWILLTLSEHHWPRSRWRTLCPYLDMPLTLSKDHWPSDPMSTCYCPYQKITDPLPRSLYTIVPIRTQLTLCHGLCIPVPLSEHHWPTSTVSVYPCPYQITIDPIRTSLTWARKDPLLLSLHAIVPTQSSLAEEPRKVPLPLSLLAIFPMRTSLTLCPYLCMPLSLSEHHWPRSNATILFP